MNNTQFKVKYLAAAVFMLLSVQIGRACSKNGETYHAAYGGVGIFIMFQPITEDLLDIALEILNSNTHYNILENGNPSRTIEEVRKEFLNQNTESYLIFLENRYIGIIDFLGNNPNDNCPWIGLLMIYGEYHSKGYGKMAYNLFEKKLKQQNYNKVRIGILQENTGAKKFWTSLGFKFYANKQWQGKTIECFEKKLL